MSNSTSEAPRFGHQNTSYQAAGQEAGLRKLATDFYEFMDQLDQAKHIRQMHEEDLSVMIDKLALFLGVWLGGPKTYIEKYGSANMIQAHRHLVIDEPEKDAWLLCMDKAIEKQPYTEDFKEYLKKQIRFPAEMIRKTSKTSASSVNLL